MLYNCVVALHYIELLAFCQVPDDPARLVELEYKLRKTEVDKKMYEVATERLLRFTAVS